MASILKCGVDGRRDHSGLTVKFLCDNSELLATKYCG